MQDLEALRARLQEHRSAMAQVIVAEVGHLGEVYEEVGEPADPEGMGLHVRLQVTDDGQWHIHTGDSQFDPDGRGAWGYSMAPIPCSEEEAGDVVDALIARAVADSAGVVMRTKVHVWGVQYFVAKGGTVVWERDVPFGHRVRNRAGGPEFRAAARYQEELAFKLLEPETEHE